MSDSQRPPGHPRRPRRTPLDLDQGGVRDLALKFKLTSDASRLRLLALLSHGEATVAALGKAIGQGPPAVSHHLALLRVAGLVRAAREGRNVRYALTDSGWAAVSAIAAMVG